MTTNSDSGLRILLGVSGGIAAYKSADLVRRLRERGCTVQVVMSEGARAFVTPLTFQALSGRPVRTSLLDPAAEAAMGHIELARWADKILIAPASADVIAKLAHGLADDLLSTLCLATQAPIFLAPAMNQQMWQAPAVQSNLEVLRLRGVSMLGPASGDQACGEVGAGRMLEPMELADVISAPPSAGKLQGQRVVITAGPTREPLDPVRFLTNRSSGKMGFALASACRAAGADVTLIAGPVQLPTPGGVQRVDVQTAQDMLAATEQAVADAQILIATAAVADYRPVSQASHKIKKSADSVSMDLEKTPDVLAQMSHQHAELFTVGFAAETRDIEQYARDKMQRKHLDMICANAVGEGRGFDVDDNALLVLWPGGQQPLGPAPKSRLAESLVDLIAERYLAGLDDGEMPSPIEIA